eukprot:TRINITY_DN2841_c0_g1_i1.p1 TRINITY_DN2841_c0_g1~~TRINITY_DN2841_c0_g1_i1.p1  ORF type:complete len:1582 (-),score=524.82 TRINITY_DN2841_c0_g1_i1:95-4840(-)
MAEYQGSPDLVCRYFATRTGFFNSKRQVVLTKSRVFVYDENDALKDNHALADIKSIINVSKGPKGVVSNEFTLVWDNNVRETYIMEGKNIFLSLFIREWTESLLGGDWTSKRQTIAAAASSSASSLHLNQAANPNQPITHTITAPYLSVFYKATQLYASGESCEWRIAVGASFIIKQDKEQMKVVAFKWIHDISKVIKFTKGQQLGVQFQFKDGSFNRYVFPGDDRSLIFYDLRQALAGTHGVEIPVEEKTWFELTADDYHSENYGPTVYKTIISKVSGKVDRIVPRSLTVTNTHLVLKNEIETFTYWGRPLESLRSLRCCRDNFILEFSSGKTCSYISPNREMILATLTAVKESAGKPISVFFNERAPGWKVGPLGTDFDKATKEVFFKRIHTLSDKTPEADMTFLLNEFNHNILLGETQFKDKKLLFNLFALLKMKAVQRDVLDITALLHALHRIFYFPGSVEQIPKIPFCIPTLMVLIQNPDPRIAATTAVLIKTCIIKGVSKNERSEINNKTIIFTDENVAAMLAMLMRSTSTDPEKNSLFTAALTGILESLLASNSHSTPRSLGKRLVSKFVDFTEIFFSLARYPCVPITKNASALLYIIMKHADDTLFRQIQAFARSTQGLIWQISLAIDSCLPDQQKISRSLVEYMVDGDPESLKLLTRMFPQDLLKVLVPTAGEGSSSIFSMLSHYSGDKMAEQFSKFASATTHQLQKLHVVTSVVDNTPTVTYSRKLFVLSERWNNFFNNVMKDYETEELIWNELTRRELVFWIEEELLTFEMEKKLHPTLKYTWNYEEFTVNYNCIANELKIGDYYISIILRKIPDVKINNPGDFVEKLFYRLLMETVAENRIQYLRVMTWVMGEYCESIEPLKYLSNVIYLLHTFTHRGIIGHMLNFLNEAFENTANVLSFVELGGSIEIIKQLQTLHTPAQEGKMHPHRVGVTALRILVKISSIQRKHTDAKGLIISPVPRLKRQLSMPQNLPFLVQVLLVDMKAPVGKQLIELTVTLLEYLIEFNDLVVSLLYKTGLFFFLMRNFEAAPLPIAKLLAKIHTKQAVCPSQSILRTFLPGTMVRVLQLEGPEAFVAKFNADIETPDFTWTPALKQFMYNKIDEHLGDIRERIQNNAGKKNLFEYSPMDHVVFPNIPDEEVPWEEEEKKQYQEAKQIEEERREEIRRREEERKKREEQLKGPSAPETPISPTNSEDSKQARPELGEEQQKRLEEMRRGDEEEKMRIIEEQKMDAQRRREQIEREYERKLKEQLEEEKKRLEVDAVRIREEEAKRLREQLERQIRDEVVAEQQQLRQSQAQLNVTPPFQQSPNMTEKSEFARKLIFSQDDEEGDVHRPFADEGDLSPRRDRSMAHDTGEKKVVRVAFTDQQRREMEEFEHQRREEARLAEEESERKAREDEERLRIQEEIRRQATDLDAPTLRVSSTDAFNVETSFNTTPRSRSDSVEGSVNENTRNIPSFEDFMTHPPGFDQEVASDVVNINIQREPSFNSDSPDMPRIQARTSMSAEASEAKIWNEAELRVRAEAERRVKEEAERKLREAAEARIREELEKRTAQSQQGSGIWGVFNSKK